MLAAGDCWVVNANSHENVFFGGRMVYGNGEIGDCEIPGFWLSILIKYK